MDLVIDRPAPAGLSPQSLMPQPQLEPQQAAEFAPPELAHPRQRWSSRPQYPCSRCSPVLPPKPSQPQPERKQPGLDCQSHPPWQLAAGYSENAPQPPEGPAASTNPLQPPQPAAVSKSDSCHDASAF